MSLENFNPSPVNETNPDPWSSARTEAWSGKGGAGGAGSDTQIQLTQHPPLDAMGNPIHSPSLPSEAQQRDNVVQAMLHTQQLFQWEQSQPTALTTEARRRMHDYFYGTVSSLNPFRGDRQPTHSEIVARAEELLRRYNQATSPSSIPYRIVQENGTIMLQHQGLGAHNGWITYELGFRVDGRNISVVNPRNNRVYGSLRP